MVAEYYLLTKVRNQLNGETVSLRVMLQTLTKRWVRLSEPGDRLKRSLCLPQLPCLIRRLRPRCAKLVISQFSPRIKLTSYLWRSWNIIDGALKPAVTFVVTPDVIQETCPKITQTHPRSSITRLKTRVGSTRDDPASAFSILDSCLQTGSVKETCTCLLQPYLYCCTEYNYSLPTRTCCRLTHISE